MKVTINIAEKDGRAALRVLTALKVQLTIAVFGMPRKRGGPHKRSVSAFARGIGHTKWHVRSVLDGTVRDNDRIKARFAKWMAANGGQ